MEEMAVIASKIEKEDPSLMKCWDIYLRKSLWKVHPVKAKKRSLSLKRKLGDLRKKLIKIDFYN
jgi:hypothetical protein